MFPDVTIHDFYKSFICKVNADIEKQHELINADTNKVDALHKYLEMHKDELKEKYGIELDEFNDEWVNKTSSSDESLLKLVVRSISRCAKTESSSRPVILQLEKYCKLLRKIAKHQEAIGKLSKWMSLKHAEYREYVAKYYNAAHKNILQGIGYKFGNGIGTFFILYCKCPAAAKRKFLDYIETSKRKKELLAEGKKLYNASEAMQYKAMGIPYDGVDYRVYRSISHYYRYLFIDTNICKSTNYEFELAKYVPKKYREFGRDTNSLADAFCKTEDDIYNIQLDLKHKLDILLYKYPTKYLNFIYDNKPYRKLIRRKDNSQD